MSANFISFLAGHLDAFVAHRSKVGFRVAKQLHLYRRFDRFVASSMPAPGPIMRPVVDGYSRMMLQETRTLERHFLPPIRAFLIYLRSLEPATYVPEARSARKERIGPRFRSCLAQRLSDFIELRASMGYRLSSYLYVYDLFDRLAAREMTKGGPVTREIVEAFLRSMAHLRSKTRQTWLCIIRQFLLYLQQFEPATYVPDRFIEPSRGYARRPYIYTEEEIKALLRAAHAHGRFPGERWLLLPTLLGLLAVTGMRISEALDLTLGDVDLKDAVLRVRKAKFQKPRLVPITDSTCRALRRYLVARAERGYGTDADAPLFPACKSGRRLSRGTVNVAFTRIRAAAGLALPSADGRRPRIHDLRHTAATRRLYLWYHDGANVQALLPALVTYLGHACVEGTATYLTTTAELLREASVRHNRLLAGANEGTR
ncbi:MAG: tyrosine-type recombinase/integrase [Acidobacteriota bacterium]